MQTGTAAGGGLSTDARRLGEALLAGKTAVVVVYNSLAVNRTQVLTLSIPAAVGGVKVTAADGTAVASQLRKATLPSDIWPGVTADLPVENELLMWAAVPALGLQTLFLTKSAAVEDDSHTTAAVEDNGPVVLENKALALVFARSGSLQQIQNKQAGIVANLSESSMVWQSTSVANNYRFQPAGLPQPLNESTLVYQTGPIVSSVTKRAGGSGNATVVQRWQLFHPPAGDDENIAAAPVQLALVDVSHAVLGPLPPNTEVSSRVFSTDHDQTEPWAQNGEYWTDESGWFVRQRHFLPDKENSSLTNLAANMVPVYGSAFARRGSDVQLTVLSGHSHGCGGGQKEALLEMFLARNPPGDDNSTVTSHFQWSLDRQKTIEPVRVASALALQQPLLAMYGAAASRDAWLAAHAPSLAPLATAPPLPPAVHLLSLDRWNSSHILLRLQHLHELDTPGTQPATVDVGALLRGFGKLGAWEETTLNAIHPRTAKRAERLVWGGGSGEAKDDGGFVGRGDGGGLVVTLSPLEIRTWVIELL